MQAMTHAIERFQNARARAFQWRDSLSVPARLGLAVGMVVLMGLSAQLRLPIPNTPVPVTGQVFVVLVAGVLLGPGYGALSMGLYLSLGLAGVPWFSGLTGRFAFTGGYLIGFIPAALVVGLIADNFKSMRYPLAMSLVMLAGVAIIYSLGALHFSLFTGAGFRDTMMLAVAPFIPWDVAKALLAGAVAGTLLPKQP